MDVNLKREIEYLTHLIKQHKQRVYQRPSKSKLVFNANSVPKPLIVNKSVVNKMQEQIIDLTEESEDVKQPKQLVKVHVNPNFKTQRPVIHFNPKVPAKPMIHLNPKVIKDMNKNFNEKGQELPQNVKRSVYVNPELMKTLSSCAKTKEKSKTESGKMGENDKTPVTKIGNSSIMIVSKRKLVRVRRNPKSPAGATNVTPSKIKRLSQGQNSKFKITKYKIDRTVVEKAKAKKVENFRQKTVAKSTNKKLELVTIGGVVYKSTRNRLVRRSLPLKRKSTGNTSNDKFLIAANGKRLQRLKSSRINANVKLNSKTIISNKVKQRSIQILRNKMRKNNQPCLLFQRFGFCAGQKKGTCSKLHDKRQVSLCKRFLQGQCFLDNCPLSHDVGPEKMPTCKYFLDGCCTRDSCPYLHVKVSSNTRVCIEFLKGYCAKGNECKRRHENVCPEFDKTGECGKGKYCPYPHKSSPRKSVKYFERRKKSVKQREGKVIEEKQEQESRLRYYEKTENIPDEIAKKRENVHRKMEIMKRIQAGTDTSQTHLENEQIDSEATNLPESEDVESNLSRPPIGILPAYIPID